MKCPKLLWCKAWSWLLAICLACSLIALIQAPGQSILVKEVPNPQRVDGTWVMDMADLISPESEDKLNQMIADLEASTSAEIAIVTVYNTQPSATPNAFATELFNTWGIGKQGRNNGVLFLVSKDERHTEIKTGSGLDHRLSNAKVRRILQRNVTPRFKAGNFDAGIVNGTQILIAAIEGHGWRIQYLSIREFIIALLLIPIALFGKRALKNKTSVGLQLSPIQEQTLPPINRWQHWLFLGIRWLAGSQIFTPHMPTLQELEERYLQSTTSISQSWLHVHHYPRQLMNHGLGLLLAGIILGTTITSMLPSDGFAWFFMMPVYPLVWLGYEMWTCTRWAKHVSESDAEQAKREILGKIGCLCFAMTFVFTLVGIFNPKIAVGVVSGIIFTCAGLVRYVRRHPLSTQIVVCANCGSPMEKLSSLQLMYRLSKSQTIEMGLKSVIYEGWHCPNHGTKKREHGLDSHLIAYLVTNNAIGYCTICKGLTVDIITTTVKKPATSALPGCRLITRKCHCCDHITQTEEWIPTRPAPRH